MKTQDVATLYIFYLFGVLLWYFLIPKKGSAVELLLGILVAVVTIVGTIGTLVLMQKGNAILAQQNEIMLAQGTKRAREELAKPASVKLSRWPVYAVVGVVFLTWAVVGYDFYDRTHPPLLEFDVPHDTLIAGWEQGVNSCSLAVNEQHLLLLRNDYKLAVACFIYNGQGDILDAPNVEVGALYDIREGQSTLTAGWSQGFIQYRVQQGAAGSFVALLIIPKNVQTFQFTTLRQARALGVRIPSVNLAKHGP